MALDDEFRTLAEATVELISLLEEADEKFWASTMRRGLGDVERHRLAGATFILGCYGGVDTFSDAVIGRALESSAPLRFRNLNARLGVLRTRVFDAANAITARRSW